MDDSKIIELYNQRNEKAIEETITKYGKYLLSIADNILDNPKDSEECINDTWLKTWESIPPCCPKNLKLFLAKITRNIACNRYNAAKTLKRGNGELALALEELDELIAESVSVEKELESQELANSLNAFLRRLPARQCDIFIRRYFYIDSIAAIANIYGIKESNVLMILSRTRKKLKIHLQSEGYPI